MSEAEIWKGKRKIMFRFGITALTALPLVGIVAATVHAQSQTVGPNQPRFDVVSIKHNDSGAQSPSGSPIVDKVGHYSARNASLRSLVSWFYGIYEFQITGGPKWFDTDRYDIEAKADAQPTREQLVQMLRALLADRFRLEAHFDSREVSRYALLAPKAGLKFGPHLAKAEDRDCSAVPAGAPGCRAVYFGQQKLAMEHITFEVLARTLSSMVGTQVFDDTGLHGTYDINLELPGTAPTISFGDTIIMALQDQTGLRFETRKAPTEVLVIDRAEKPTEN
jgi:uncharacterized protein (TIGR03435 family)